jgi:hypothetical protein
VTPAPFADHDRVLDQRRKDADTFYDGITPPAVKADADRRG